MQTPKAKTTAVVHKRAEYLVSLMPRLGKNLHTRVAKPRFSLTRDLTEGQMTLLFFLMEHGPATMRELSRLVQVAMSTMTEIVERMVNLKLVTRAHSREDRRIIRVQVTSAGRQAFKAKFNNARKIFENMLESLSEQDQEELIRAFQSIERILLHPRSA